MAYLHVLVSLQVLFSNLAYYTDARPAHLSTPLVFRAPEAVFYERSSGKVESDWNLSVDIWSLGCLVSLVHNFPLNYLTASF